MPSVVEKPLVCYFFSRRFLISWDNEIFTQIINNFDSTGRLKLSISFNKLFRKSSITKLADFYFLYQSMVQEPDKKNWRLFPQILTHNLWGYVHTAPDEIFDRLHNLTGTSLSVQYFGSTHWRLLNQVKFEFYRCFYHLLICRTLI